MVHKKPFNFLMESGFTLEDTLIIYAVSGISAVSERTYGKWRQLLPSSERGFGFKKMLAFGQDRRETRVGRSGANSKPKEWEKEHGWDMRPVITNPQQMAWRVSSSSQAYGWDSCQEWGQDGPQCPSVNTDASKDRHKDTATANMDSR